MFNTLSEVKVVKPGKKKTYDIKYDHKADRFTVNAKFAEQNNLDTKGFKLFQDQEGEAVFVIVPESDATIYKRTRQDAKVKSSFRCDEMKKLLAIDGDFDIKFNANITTIEGYRCFYLSPVEEKQTQVVEPAII